MMQDEWERNGPWLGEYLGIEKDEAKILKQKK